MVCVSNTKNAVQHNTARHPIELISGKYYLQHFCLTGLTAGAASQQAGLLTGFVQQLLAPVTQQALSTSQQSAADLTVADSVTQQPSTPQQPHTQAHTAQVQAPVSQQKQPSSQHAQQLSAERLAVAWLANRPRDRVATSSAIKATFVFMFLLRFMVLLFENGL